MRSSFCEMFAIRRYGPGLAASLVALAVLCGCDTAGPDKDDRVVAGIDFDVLFAPPSIAELAAVEADWSSRSVEAADIEAVLDTVLVSGGWGATVRVFRHRVGGIRHVGAVLVPVLEPDRPRPVLLYLHASDGGVSIDAEVVPLMALSEELRDEFIVVVPAFRDEAIRLEGAEFVSEGPASPWDRDVDDALALLDVALATTPAADPDRVVALGFSRGAAVGLLAAVRDARIDGVVDFFGPTDFLSPFSEDVLREALTGGDLDLPGLDYLVSTVAVPLSEGDLGMEAARLELIRRSVLYFAARLPAVQIHHGSDDEVVPASESEALERALSAAGNSDFELYIYENGVHHPLSLPGALERVTSFLLRTAALIEA